MANLPLPTDINGVPYLANQDGNGDLAVPFELFRKVGGLYLPVDPDQPLPVLETDRLYYLTADHDSIAVGAVAKGELSTPFDSVTSGGTSREILCAGFNALLLHHVITGAPATGGYATITMSPKSGGTFVAHHGDGQNIKGAAVTASYISLFRGILDYIKVVLTVTDGTHTVIVQPLNI